MDADFAALQLRRGASAAEVRAAYLALSRRHHPDRGGDAALFRRVNQAYAHLSRGEGGGGAGGASGGPPAQRATKENAPTAWARPDAAARAPGPLRLEQDPRLEAAFRFAGETRKHLNVIDRYPAHAGWTFSASGSECGPGCLIHIAPATPDGVACAQHKRVHRCAAGVCTADAPAVPEARCAAACGAGAVRSAPQGGQGASGAHADGAAPVPYSFLGRAPVRAFLAAGACHRRGEQPARRTTKLSYHLTRLNPAHICQARRQSRVPAARCSQPARRHPRASASAPPLHQ